jgi:hypothetical protein
MMRVSDFGIGIPSLFRISSFGFRVCFGIRNSDFGPHIWLFLCALLLLTGACINACPICQGWGQPSLSQKLVTAPEAVLAAPTAEVGRFRVVHVVKGEQQDEKIRNPKSEIQNKLETGNSETQNLGDTIEGGYPRSGLTPADAAPTNTKLLLLVRSDPFPTWVILGAIDAARLKWLRELAAGKPAADRSLEDWRARVALVVPHLDDPEPLARDLAYAELGAAPYEALRTLRPHLDAAALRQWLADPEFVQHRPLCLLLLGISGDPRDAAAIEERLETSRQSSDSANVSSMLAADLELRGVERLAWVETNYLADPKRSPPEIKAALLALSVHGNANGAIPRERVIRSYRLFLKQHPEIAGDVAPDLGAWQYWDAAADYLALMKSGVRQQYPSLLAMLAYLRQNPQAKALGFAPEAAPADGKSEPWNPPLPQR